MAKPSALEVVIADVIAIALFENPEKITTETEKQLCSNRCMATFHRLLFQC
jgi:hypothetical protein